MEDSYPHCWRCHNATIFRATEQWFIGMDRNNLRQRALEAIHNVNWKPSGCEEPMPCGNSLVSVVKLFREQTSDVWYTKSAAELAGPGAKCSKCGGTSFRKENDILDVWFDSGVSHLDVLKPENGLSWPSDMYLEGGDQYRGWFHSSLLVAVGLRGSAPYRASATSGWTLDGEGHALSKSRGSEAV